MKKSINCGWILLFATLFTIPATAHNVETQKDVGATIHIEPNDDPRAGKTALTWFALTQKGGKIIPLNDCNCSLSVYSKQNIDESKPLQQPPLKAVSQEGYQGIPSAEITFPAAGAYQLHLEGTPKAGAKFSAFELQFDVNVAPGIEAPKSTSISTQVAIQEQEISPTWLNPVIAIGAIFTGAIALVVWQKLYSKPTTKD